MYDHPFVCSLSGVSAPEVDIEEAKDHGDGTPDGWVKIAISRKFLNPKWVAIQGVKAGLYQQLLETIPEENREVASVNVALQIEAQYASLEHQTPKFVEEEEEIFIAPPESDSALFQAYNKVRDLLGLEAEEMPSEDDDNSPIPFLPSQEATDA
jgi:hypothetical protein